MLNRHAFLAESIAPGLNWEPGGWASYTGTAATPELGVGGGRAVAVYFDATDPSPLHIAVTADGITWTGSTPTSGISSAARVTRPTRDPNNGFWFFCVSTATVCEVWRSKDNGATWAIAKTFIAGTDVEAQATSMMGPVWAMLTTKGRALVSRDYGASWRVVANLDGTSSNWSMTFGGGGALILNSADKSTMYGVRGGRTPGAAI